MTAHADALADFAGAHLDLVSAPFTFPGSRILVFREGDGIRIHTAEYERRLAECRVIDELVVTDAAGAVLPITAVRPHLIEFGGAAVTLTFADPVTLSLGGAGVATWRTPDGREHRAELAPAIELRIRPDRGVDAARSSAHDPAVSRSAATWRAWFEKCPLVRDDLQQMTAFCWWVLGANIVSLPRLGDVRAVVPSKIGYVGLWQWDAYFIAVGLRHGDPELAREQLDLAFRFPTSAGQLPDVVHEEGVLASSDDLPESDRDTLRRAGSTIADPAAPIPLTKPPLAAWALRKVLEVAADDEWAQRQLGIIRRSQDWWFAASDLDHDGMPEYGHPYSSGLDDSPVFDGPLPTTSPDLSAYLVLQDLELARFAHDEQDAAAHRARASRTLALLVDTWDSERGVFPAHAAGAPVASDAIVGLMPLLTGALPRDIADRLVAALDDPTRYGLPWGLPTVAASDPDFSPQRMWRGPTWINTNALVVEGLRSSGYPERARKLAERTVALVIHGGGPHEYFDPFTGERAETATTAFGWSAALFIDLAVGLSRE